MHSRLLVSGLLAALVGSLLVALTAPSAYAVDKDCADFDSQRAAQLFFLRHGGPDHDPHRLDDDSDGVACETNPPPYYRKRTLPGAGPAPKPRVVTSVRLRGPVRSFVAGERVRLTVRVRPAVRRTVVLQRRTDRGWRRDEAARTTRRGRLVVQVRARARSQDYRVVVPRLVTPAKRFTRARSGRVWVRTVAQRVALELRPTRVGEGEGASAVAEAFPARPSRVVVLQERTSAGWRTVDSGVQGRGGRVRFLVPGQDAGVVRFRAVVRASGGAASARSAVETLTVDPPPPVDVPPAAPTGVRAEAGDGSVLLTWDAVAASDLAGYVVEYRRADETGWSPAPAPAGTSVAVTGLPNDVEHHLRVAALDAAGHRSPWSEEVSATPRAPAPVG